MEKYSRIEKMPFDFGVGDPLFPAEIKMVSTVVGHGSSGVTDLARELGITKGAVSQIIGRLCKKGLLSREKDQLNRARSIIRATESGRIAHDNHMEFHKHHDAEFIEFLGGLDDDSYRLVCELSEKMNSWMDNYLE
ncbi:MarR family winged helix-turn-helix transcriptional regulator [Maridesulfovibrio zosterae]|uniref:MarR family winged helix-turn-helix transcriptional regulator n=1 Tax=Maridesulfovibrio zosterae TaxID=82171 RepID=UPI001FE16834|nr:MarR family winged helix-turn-helix transcriptional regulator [Maridesulfovibrio zosterae]